MILYFQKAEFLNSAFLFNLHQISEPLKISSEPLYPLLFPLHSRFSLSIFNYGLTPSPRKKGSLVTLVNQNRSFNNADYCKFIQLVFQKLQFHYILTASYSLSCVPPLLQYI